MKKIKSLLTIVLSLLLTVSCDDAIDIVQDGELPIDLNNETDLAQYLRGQIYKNLDASSEISLTAVFTDEVSIGVDNGGQDISLHRFFLNPSDGYVSDIWLTHYTVINGVNKLLKEAEDIPVTAAYSSTLAEARVLRAYSYLQLLTYFSTDMADDDALGVMLLDFVPELNTRLPRVSNGEIYALIEADLAYGLVNIKSNDNASQAYKYVTKNLINSIYARMYTYRKNYVLAKQYAETVKSESQLKLTLAKLDTPTDTDDDTSTPDVDVRTFPYAEMWADAAQGEIIFALSRPAEGAWGNIASAFYFNTTDRDGGAYLEMGRILFNQLGAVSNDTRRKDFVDSSVRASAIYETSVNYIKEDILPINKYPGKGNSTPLRNDLKAFRLSEIYFILAECAIFQGDLTTAAQYIKDVRQARLIEGTAPTPTYASVTAALGDLLDERRKELCYEGFRYVDIKRLGSLAGKSVERHPTDDQIKSLPTTISNTDYRFTLPIPQLEVSGNPTIKQNPGY